MKQKQAKTNDMPVILRAEKYCAYQERSQHEVRNKLHEWGTWGTEAENIIVELISKGFINEERFAIALARGKFRIKHWGKIKITQALKLHHVSPYCIKVALQQIPDDEYVESLKKILSTKTKGTKGKLSPLNLRKLINFAYGKGYEIELIKKVLQTDED
jgi:regulatory protein